MLKKTLFTFSAIVPLLAAPVLAEEKTEIDMSDPTDAYTSLGIGYGTKGVGVKIMALLSEPGAKNKAIFILEGNDMLDEEGEDYGRFNGLASDKCKHQANGLCFDAKKKNRNFRFRWASMNTTNGLGLTADAVVKEHPLFGQMTVAQFGGISTLPVSENTTFWALMLAGGVIIEDNMALYNPNTPAINSDGVDWASTVYSFKMYARQKFTDRLWFLGSVAYTHEMKGKSYSKGVSRGGLGIGATQFEFIYGYQITPTQNITIKHFGFTNSGSTERVSLEYNYAF